MSYLIKRNGWYYFRMMVPRDMVGLLRRREIKKVLKTRYFIHGQSLAKLYGFQAEKLFVLTRSGIMSDKQLKVLIEESRPFRRGATPAVADKLSGPHLMRAGKGLVATKT